VELLVQRYPRSLKKLAEASGLILMAAFFALMAWKSLAMALRVLQEGRNLEIIPLPQFPFRCFVPAGAAFFSVEAILQLMELIKSDAGERADVL